jgi:hypothetical protein
VRMIVYIPSMSLSKDIQNLSDQVERASNELQNKCSPCFPEASPRKQRV